MATRSVRTVSATGAATGGGGYTHPECICNAVHCSPCYITNYTSHQDGVACSRPSEGAQWVTLISQCGSDIPPYSGFCIDFDYDYYNFQEVTMDIILYTPATTGATCVWIGNENYLHCTCYNYMFERYCSFGSINCYGALACTACTCRYIHFNATFKPHWFCTDQHIISSGCTSPAVGGIKHHFGGLGSYNGNSSYNSVPFHVCSYFCPGGVYCQFWCNFSRVRIQNNNVAWCNSPAGIDKIHIAGKPYKAYTPA